MTADDAIFRAVCTPPCLIVAYQIGKCVMKDVEEGSCHNTVKKVCALTSMTVCGVTGCAGGFAIYEGVPAIGIVGGLFFGVLGGYGGYKIGNRAAEILLESFGYLPPKSDEKDAPF